jgi:hypothetical protein
MWYPMTRPHGIMLFSHMYIVCPMMIHPTVHNIYPVSMPLYLPCQRIATCRTYLTTSSCMYLAMSACCIDLATLSHAMCHPCSGSKCHNMTGPPITINFLVSTNASLPRHLYDHTDYMVSCHLSE